MRTRIALLLLAALVCLDLVVSACGATTTTSILGDRSEGADPSALPADVQASYRVFVQRCSKCHALARVYESGITDDDYWVRYVARMRRQPGSGISKGDESVILHYLFYYSAQKRDAGSSTTASNP